MKEMKEYLGDSVYAEMVSGGILLTTNNGKGPSNVIFLDPEVLTAFNRFAKNADPYQAMYDTAAASCKCTEPCKCHNARPQ